MLLPLGAAAIVAAALLWELARPRVRASLPRLARVTARRWGARHGAQQLSYDPGRELRAEQRARELLRSCVNEEEWAMYRDLGFLRVWAPARAASGCPAAADAGGLRDFAPGIEAQAGLAPGIEAQAGLAPGIEAQAGLAPGIEAQAGPPGGSAAGKESAHDGVPYAYLLYPHKPIVAYVPQTGALLNEYCVAFPDDTRPFGSARLPDADDVLAKWMALSADERRLIADANMHLPGRQIDPEQVRKDLGRLARWERERMERLRRAERSAPGSPRGWRSRPEAGDGDPPAPSLFI
jgi:hypothetical protein